MRLLLFLGMAFPLSAQPSETCAKCHTAIQHEAATSLHGEMMQPATKQSVEANFAQAKAVLHGSTYLFREGGGSYYITESDLTGKPWEHRIEYTLGVRRVQHYLTTLPDGRMILIPAAWDNVGKQWVHDVDIGNPEESSGDRILIWNKTCFGCHVTGEEKNFDPQRGVYHTAWQDLGVSCGSCHGPGNEHLAHPAKGTIVNPAHLDKAAATAVCAQCHSLRNVYADGFTAGANYDDFFLPAMEYALPASDDPAFWPDGRPRWFSNEAVALWQSQCYLKGGATCSTCHTAAHNSQLPASANALCAGCHKAIGANVPAHTHHASASAGSSCVECHMPRTVTGLKAQFRDHSMSIPAPENTVRHSIPNACNTCHRDHDAAWAEKQAAAWYGPQAGRKAVERADAFAQARANDSAAVPALLAILADSSAGAWARANAAGYLGNFPNDPSASNAVHHAFTDADALVRATAASVIKPSRGERAEIASDLVPLLRDPARTVRMSAGIALVNMGVKPFPGDDGARYEQAKELYRARAALVADDAEQQLAAGKFFFLAGDMDGAADALRASLKLAPSSPAQYLLGRTLAEKGAFDEAKQILEAIPRTDPGYASAQALIAQIDAQPAGASAGQGQFQQGQVRLNSHFYQAALNDFDQALKLAPQAEWAAKAQIGRAICLEKLARTGEAEQAMQALEANPAARQDMEFDLAYAELLFDTGRVEDAAKQVDAAIAAAPQAPLAFFWRAKVLFELDRAAEAEAAAGQSIRLDPQTPEAHNLLMRIDLKLGRAREAAQEAQWLRDYERRAGQH